ncbi:uncharacterized protein L201_005984 [Kwoniella dendrophila CBS 6074]|uniref:Heme oxygenase 2 n=1 Tax=Kwoniella dendrophila CBS 6074 TaxID=1295534 RepID=A0AAX4K1P8_9TREE
MNPICPFANLSIIQSSSPSLSSKPISANTIKQLHLNISNSSTPLESPSFSPNTPINEDPIGTGKPKPKQHSARGNKHSLDGELDLNQPVSTLLRLGTQRAHVKAEHSAGAAALVQGNLGLEEYIRWLVVLWRIYDSLELGLSENSSNPVLAPTYDPSLLARAPALAEDISYLLTLLPSSSSSSSSSTSTSLKATPLPPFPLPSFLEEVFFAPPEPLLNYLNHIKSLSSTLENSSKLLAHSYVRYLGDLSGGQFIGSRVKKSYHLNQNDNKGTQFYYFEFQNRSTTASSSLLDEGQDESKFDAKKRLSEVKDWFRNGMDEGVGEDELLKAELVEEANIAFSLNTDLFSVIRLPSTSPSYTTTTTTTPNASAKIGTVDTKPKMTLSEKLDSFVWFTLAAALGFFLNYLFSDWVRAKTKLW